MSDENNAEGLVVCDLRNHNFRTALVPLVVLHDRGALSCPFGLVEDASDASFEGTMENELVLRSENTHRLTSKERSARSKRALETRRANKAKA